jgi:RNA:NAD 2'-phosphotransferase (TPT1/KptA family)
MDSKGYVELPSLISCLKHKTTEAEVRFIVATDTKRRYSLDEQSQPVRIRANQGHSVHLADLDLHVLKDAAEVPVAIHVTSAHGWEAIQQCGQLRRMRRNHIHFATIPHHMRRNDWATVVLRLDVAQALQEGHRLLRAANDVLLCEGPLPVHLVHRIDRTQLPPDWQ